MIDRITSAESITSSVDQRITCACQASSMLDLVTERDSALEIVARIQQRVADLFGPEAADLDGLTSDLKLSRNGLLLFSVQCSLRSEAHVQLTRQVYQNQGSIDRRPNSQ